MGYPKAKLSTHAYQRVRGRLSLLPHEVRAILDLDKTVLVGNDGSKYHRLFYSLPDQMAFIAVQDMENGEVITILPPDYHNRWRVSTQNILVARNIILGLEPIQSETAATNVQPKSRLEIQNIPGPKRNMNLKYKVVCFFGQGQKQKLGSWFAVNYSFDINAFLNNEEVRNELRIRISRLLCKQKIEYVHVLTQKNTETYPVPVARIMAD